MAYFGTVVLTRLDGLVTDRAELFAVGHRSARLRQLGGGWQLLETSSGPYDPPDLMVAASAWYAAVGEPILAAYVSESSCCAVYGAGPAGDGWSVHLPGSTQPCDAYVYRPQPAGMPAEQARLHFSRWARAAGLSPHQARLERLSGPQPLVSGEGNHMDALDLVFELVEALGAPAVTEPLPYVLDPVSQPFEFITERFGLADAVWIAEFNCAKVGRPVVGYGRPPRWAAEALELDRRIWAAAHIPDHDPAELVAAARRMLALVQEYQRDEPPECPTRGWESSVLH